MKAYTIICLAILALGIVVKAEEEAVMLPPMSEERLDECYWILVRTKYPVRFNDLYERLGGKKGLIWCCNIRSEERAEMVFAISDPNGKDGRYEIRLEFRPPPTGPYDNAMCTRARLAYRSPFGRTFYAEDLVAKSSSQLPPAPTAPVDTPPSSAGVATALGAAHPQRSP